MGAVTVGLLQAVFQFVHVAIGEAVAPGLAEPDAVDDRGVVEGVGNDCVFLAEQRLEQPAIGVEAGGEQDGVVLLQIAGDRFLEAAVERLRPADEAHRGHAEAELVHRPARRGNDLRVIGEAEIVVGAQVDEVAPAALCLHLHMAALRSGDQALRLEEAGGFEIVEDRFDPFDQGIFHHGHRIPIVGGAVLLPRS